MRRDRQREHRPGSQLVNSELLLFQYLAVISIFRIFMKYWLTQPVLGFTAGICNFHSSLENFDLEMSAREITGTGGVYQSKKALRKQNL